MEFNFIDPRRDSLQYNRSRGYNRWLMSEDVELGRAFFSSFSLLTSFLPSDIPREVILPLKLRANSIEGTWELSFQHHRHSFQRRLSVCLSNYFSNFFRSSLAVLSFFSFSCNWGEWLHCQVSPPFLEAEVSLVFG